MRLLVALIIAVALAAWPGPGGHFAGARDANGGIDPALLKKAEGGSKTAQKLLGMKYASGKKVAKDLIMPTHGSGAMPATMAKNPERSARYNLYSAKIMHA